MIIARWSFDARFGHKDEVLAIMRQWQQEFGSVVGLESESSRLLVGSIGAGESTIVVEHSLPDIAALDARWKRLAQAPGMATWSKRLEPHIVSGSNRWEVYRVME